MRKPVARLHSLRSVQLRVPTLAESRDFYADVWGLAVVEDADAERDGPRVDARDTRAAAQTSSLATSYTASTSSTWSLLSNRRRTHALCTFIFGPPIASAPSTTLPS